MRKLLALMLGILMLFPVAALASEYNGVWSGEVLAEDIAQGFFETPCAISVEITQDGANGEMLLTIDGDPLQPAIPISIFRNTLHGVMEVGADAVVITGIFDGDALDVSATILSEKGEMVQIDTTLTREAPPAIYTGAWTGNMAIGEVAATTRLIIGINDQGGYEATLERDGRIIANLDVQVSGEALTLTGDGAALSGMIIGGEGGQMLVGGGTIEGVVKEQSVAFTFSRQTEAPEPEPEPMPELEPELEPEPEPELEPELEPEPTEATYIGSWLVSVAGAERTEGWGGETLLRVYYDYTNLSESADSVFLALTPEAEQDGEPLQRGYARDEVPEDLNATRAIKPGVSIRATEVFELMNDSLVELRVTEFTSDEGGIVDILDPNETGEILPIPQRAAYEPSAGDASGVVGDAHVSIEGCERFIGEDGEDAARVLFSYTNNAEDAHSFFMATTIAVFQNGVELLELYHLEDAETDANGWADAAPGETITVSLVLGLIDDSPLEVEVASYWDDPVLHALLALE